MADYWSRIRQQEALYETVTAAEGPYIKVQNVGETIEVNQIEGEPSVASSAWKWLTR